MRSRRGVTAIGHIGYVGVDLSGNPEWQQRMTPVTPCLYVLQVILRSPDPNPSQGAQPGVDA